MDNFIIHHCQNCDLCFKENLKKDKAFDIQEGDYYLSKLTGNKVDARYKKHFLRRSKDHLKYIEKFIDKKNFSKSALDIGCGAGIFLSQLRSKGWKVEGLELDPCMLDYAINFLELNVSNEYFENWESKEKYGLIYLSHVLDDLPDIKNSMKKINKKIASKGLLFIEVPNLSIKFRINFEKEAELKVAEYFFSEKSLVYILESSGFTVIDIKTFKLVHLNTFLQKVISPFVFVTTFLPKKFRPYLRVIAKKNE
jgi:2-polyprenyl-3-methyl-5-hydroxy-6-metoxy-1,4-benzoquinol methylase